MKSYIVVGFGRFGTEVARQLCALGGEVLAVDSNEELVNQISNAHVQQLRTQADYVILDTPPMLAAADAEYIAALADTAVLVVRSDFMSTGSINEGLDKLRKSAPEVCGFVLNNYRTTIR